LPTLVGIPVLSQGGLAFLLHFFGNEKSGRRPLEEKKTGWAVFPPPVSVLRCTPCHPERNDSGVTPQGKDIIPWL